jgi:DMSO/TMAO reductase YedYZ heme-binding membrane subunit
MSGHLTWYTARSAGIVAWALAAASVVWGLLLSSRVFGRRPKPSWLLDLHRYLGGLAVVFTAVHVVAIMADSYVSFGLTDVLVPLATSWHPVAVAWGIVGMYLLIAVEVTSLLRHRMPTRLWRRVHYLSFPLLVLASVHGLTAGTDGTSPLFEGGLICVGGLVAALLVARGERAEAAAARSQERAGWPATLGQ